MLQGPDRPLSPSPAGEHPNLISMPETFSAPAPSPPGDTAPLLSSDAQIGEEMVPDARAALTPAQMVERKVIALLKGHSLPISYAVAGFHRDQARRRRLRRSAG